MMDRIVARVEQDPGWRAMIEASRRAEPEHATADAIAAAAAQVCHTIGAKAIVAFTASRPRQPCASRANGRRRRSSA